MKSLVLFDFDGTLTTKDTFLEFTRFHCGNYSYYSGLLLLSPFIIMHFAGLLSSHRLKERFLQHYFAGEKESELKKRGIEFCSIKLPSQLRKDRMMFLEEKRNSGSDIAIVSASLDWWLTPFAEQHGATLLCTQAETEDGLITGYIRGRNCNYNEKVHRIRTHFDIDSYDEILAFGNSKGDAAMIALKKTSGLKV